MESMDQISAAGGVFPDISSAVNQYHMRDEFVKSIWLFECYIVYMLLT